MNYVSKENMADILDGIARKIGQGGSGTGLEDWQASHEYTYNDICVYEGQIYRAKVGFTSDITFSTTQILEEYTTTGEETIIPYEKDTEISIDDIVSYDNNTYKALYNFVCGEEFSLYALQEYVPQELTDIQEAEIINHFMPNIYSGGNMSVEDSTPIGTIISFMGTIAPENYLVCDGTIYNIADYIELAEFINTQFGSYNYFGGDGITTFAVPDLQGEFLRMTGTNSHAEQGSGANVGVHQDGTEHNTIFTTTNQIRVLGTDSGEIQPSSSDSRYKVGTGNIKWLSASASPADTSATWDVQTSRPTNTSVLYCIKYQMSITNAEEIKDLTTADMKQIIDSYNPVFEEAKGIEYSTEERRIGTWIDGKPLYQKTYSCTTPSVAETNTTIQDIANLNLEECVSIGGYVSANGWQPSINFTIGIYKLQTWCNDADAEIRMYVSSSFVNLPVYITLQYTKTTD